MSYDSDTPKQIDLFNGEASQEAADETAPVAKSSKSSTRERGCKPWPIAAPGAPGAPAWNGAPQYLTVKDVASYFSISVATVWRWADRVSEFPAPIRLSEGVTRWRLQDIQAFEAGLQSRRAKK